jgi:hypothetical protein
MCLLYLILLRLLSLLIVFGCSSASKIDCVEHLPVDDTVALIFNAPSILTEKKLLASSTHHKIETSESGQRLLRQLQVGLLA